VSAEFVERRVLTKRKPHHAAGMATQSAKEPDSGLMRLREAAARERRQRFNNLLHHVTASRLKQAYESLKKDAATGIDGVSWVAYGVGLEDRLTDLHHRIHAGRYRAQPVRRQWIPKANGTLRPLGITCVEDKVVQHALVQVMQAIYEVDFLGFSYGFRPGRSQHDALDAVFMAVTTQKVSYLLDADIEAFFDRIPHDKLLAMLKLRVTDPRVLRLIEQTLTVGVEELRFSGLYAPLRCAPE
jgi:RNA-directed DNA polymerase